MIVVSDVASAVVSYAYGLIFLQGDFSSLYLYLYLSLVVLSSAVAAKFKRYVMVVCVS